MLILFVRVLRRLCHRPENQASACSFNFTFLKMNFTDAFFSLPFFTRSWLGLTFAITAAVTLDVIPPEKVTLDWHRVINFDSNSKYESLESWRVLTSFCYCGAPLTELYSLFLLYTIFTYGNGYEKNPFPAGSGSSTADALFSILFCVICILCTHPLPEYLLGATYALYPILTRNLTYSLLYLWSKRNPHAIVQLNFIPMEGRYLPFAHLGISLFLDNRLHELIHGFLVAHLYYFLTVVAPMQRGGRLIIRTPRVLVELLGEEANIVSGNDDQSQFQQQMFRFRDQDDATQAHIAAKLGNLQQIRHLVEEVTPAGGQRRRYFLTASDRNGWQPLHEACRGGYIEIVQYLVIDQAEFVDIHATTNSGHSPISLSQEYHGEDHPVTKLLQEMTTLRND